jgi:hypothetical protein
MHTNVHSHTQTHTRTRTHTHTHTHTHTYTHTHQTGLMVAVQLLQLPVQYKAALVVVYTDTQVCVFVCMFLCESLAVC